MKEKTSSFWFIATVVLAAMYLTSNPTLTRKVGSQLSEIWQGVISRVKAPQPLATTENTEQKQLAEPQRLVGPTSEQQEQQRSDSDEETALLQNARVGGDGKDQERVDQQTQPQRPTPPEVKMKDVLRQPQERPQAGVSGKSETNEKDMPLEIVKEIYARHLEALKILNSKPESEKNEN
jgi:hypothetical protein